MAAGDPISAILGGRPAPAIGYGWLADEGLDYYGYGVGHGTERRTQHPAIDVPVPCGTPLYAPAAGVVDCVGNAGTPRWGQGCGAYADVDGGGIGNITILLDPGTVKLTLGHCRGNDVRPGQRVAAGQRVGSVGSMNGCHVHVETSIERNGTYCLVEPVAAIRGVMAGARPTPPAPPGKPHRIESVALPAGVTLPDLAAWFGDQFDPDGLVTTAWAEEGARTGRWPRLVRFDPAGPERRFFFEGGLILRLSGDRVGPLRRA